MHSPHRSRELPSNMSAAIEAQRRYASASRGLPPLGDSGGRMQPYFARYAEPRLLIWERLEERRSRRYGVQPLKNFNVTRSQRIGRDPSPVAVTFYHLDGSDVSRSRPASAALLSADAFARQNTIAPFGTLAPKATCGYYFNMETDNRKLRIGIPASDLVKWRSDGSSVPVAASAGPRGPQDKSVKKTN